MFEKVPAFLGGEKVADVCERLAELVECPGADAAEVSFQLGEGHFDGVQIGAVGGQEQKPASLGLQRLGGLRCVLRLSRMTTVPGASSGASWVSM